jgi:pimeloyl-ACP methyl ester carboxylesterase
MARDMIAAMKQLGFDRFHLAGHDRGGRVAYRMAQDHPSHVMRLAVLDVVPGMVAWEDPTHAHAICEEYRAAASLDREHDRADRASGRRIACPVLVLWSTKGALDKWYEDEGGPIGVWDAWANGVRGHGLDAGHFFPEEMPDATAEALMKFFGEA